MIVNKHFANFMGITMINPLNAKLTKWSNILKQFVDKLPTNCLSVFDHFVGLALKGLRLRTRNFQVIYII